jgi:Protein of unknown function (DUF3810)
MRLVRAVLILAALAAALVPIPPRLVESYYSKGIYPAVQSRITPVTNLSPIALVDLAVLAIVVFFTIAFARRLRARGLTGAVLSGAVNLLTLTAFIVLWFFAVWGANYRRVPLDQKLAYDTHRITREAAVRLGNYALQEVNTRYAAAHSRSGDGVPLAAAFSAAQQTLGASRLAVPGTPKRSLLELYFRRAAIDGMTDPFFLEVILNPDVLPFEHPFVLAHEWAHLAGYANEGEANFVAWLTCSQGDAMAVYSGWMAIFEHVVAALPKGDRVALTSQLQDGPRRDLQEAAARYARSSPVVRTAARDVYDSYLRANRVPEGVESYSTVVQLMLGAGLDDGRRPTLR